MRKEQGEKSLKEWDTRNMVLGSQKHRQENRRHEKALTSREILRMTALGQDIHLIFVSKPCRVSSLDRILQTKSLPRSEDTYLPLAVGCN